MNEPAVELAGVTKRFSGHTAVRNLSLRVPRGSIYGLLGPNGAGKTTTLRMILNIFVPDEGSVVVFGQANSGRAMSTQIGYLPEERGLYRKMKVVDLLVFLAEAKGMERRRARKGALGWLEQLDLGAWGRRRVDELSKGMQQKVQFISTVLHEPQLVILDEAFAGLDPVNTQVLKDTVLGLARGGTTILFSTHIMEQAERLCDSVCIIAAGAKVVDGRLSEVKGSYHGTHVALAVEGGVSGIESILSDRSVVSKTDTYGGYAELELREGIDPQELLRNLVNSGVTLTRFEIREPSLHKIFLDKVGANQEPELVVGGGEADA